MINPAITSSLTALAFAPGALNTGMPRALIAATGMLLTPAPARPIARTVGGISRSCRSYDRTIIAAGAGVSEDTRYRSFGSRASPRGEIAFSVSTSNTRSLQSEDDTKLEGSRSLRYRESVRQATQLVDDVQGDRCILKRHAQRINLDHDRHGDVQGRHGHACVSMFQVQPDALSRQFQAPLNDSRAQLADQFGPISPKRVLNQPGHE